MEDGWKPQGEKNGVNIFSRRDEKTVGIKMEKIIDIPVEMFLTVVSEIDFYYELIPDIK